MLPRSLQFTMWFCFLYLPQLKLQASAFLQINAGRSYHHQPASPSSLINLAMTPPNNNSDDDTNPNSRNRTPVDANTSILNHRLSKMRAQLFEDQLALPPNPNLTPTEFVTSILEQLKHPDAFMPQSGFRTLVRSSSGQWKEKLRRSIGVPPDLDGLVKEDTFISALASAISRPNNQYQILVHDSDHDYDDEKKGGTRKSYDDTELYFPGDVVDYMDGKCWLEAQLRDRESGKLLVILGWSLVQNERREWLIDRLDWQDFRDEFRPGIGREEWMRICG